MRSSNGSRTGSANPAHAAHSPISGSPHPTHQTGNSHDRTLRHTWLNHVDRAENNAPRHPELCRGTATIIKLGGYPATLGVTNYVAMGSLATMRSTSEVSDGMS
jgi:hypothetical protein